MIDIGIVTLTRYESGFLGIQVDGFSSPTEGLQPGFYQPPHGLYSRPLDPVLDPQGTPIASQSCEAEYRWEGGRIHVRPTNDPRLIPQLPALSKGSSVFYGGTAGGVGYVHVEATTRVVTLGQLAGALPVALATPLAAYLTALEMLLAAIAKTGSEAAVSAFVSAQASNKVAISALLAKAF